MTAVAIVGATGAVGRTMLRILEEREFPVSSLRLLASARSAGQVVETAFGEVTIEDLAEADPAGVDIALFSAGGERSRLHAPRFVREGSTVVDNSSAFRRHDGVPLVVVGVNDHALDDSRLIANPNCSTMTLMMAAGPLHRAAELRSMVVASYQSVSGSGQRGIDELVHQSEILGKNPDLLIEGGWSDPGSEVYPRPIGWNVIPFAGVDEDSGYTDEEWKLVHESRKILEIDDLGVEPTCVRVPSLVGHGVSATLRLQRSLEADEAMRLIDDTPGVEVWADRVPTPLDSAGRDEVLVGRVRQTMAGDGINLWAVGDNLRKGAALNAVQIAELVVGR